VKVCKLVLLLLVLNSSLARGQIHRAHEVSSFGAAYNSPSQYDKTIEFLGRVLAIRREAKDRPGEAIALNNLGAAYQRLSQYEKAIGYYEQALAIRREVKDRAGEANTLNNLGVAFNSLYQHEKAIGYYEQALAIRREVKDRTGELQTLLNMGLAYRSLNQHEKAIGYYEHALAIQREVMDRAGEATTLNYLGMAFNSLSQYEKAIGYYEQALAIRREVKDGAGEGALLNNLGVVYSSISQYEKAIGYHEQALAIAREAKNRTSEGAALSNLGAAQSMLSRYEKAIGYYEQALKIRREVKDRRGEANTLSNLGSAYGSMSQYEKAIGYYEEALKIRREVKDRGGESWTLNNLGHAYQWLSQCQKAIGYYEQALAIAREAKDRRGEGTTLNSLGEAHALLKQYEKAIGYFEQALAIRREVKDRAGEGVTLGNLGVAYDWLRQSGRSIGYHEQALAIRREVKDRMGEGTVVGNLGLAYGLLKQYEKAVEYHEQALAIAREVKDSTGEAVTLANLMVVHRALKHARLAILFGKQAINTWQSIRGDIRGLPTYVQQSYLQDKEPSYRRLADLLVAEARLPEAQQVLGLLKQEEFFEFVRRDRAAASAFEGRADLTSEEAEWAQRYQEMSERLVAAGRRYQQLNAKRSPSEAERAELAAVERDLETGNRAFQEFLRRLAQHFAAPSAAASTNLLQIKEAEGLQRTLEALGHDAVAIYTLVGEDRYRAILVTPTVRRAYESPIAATELNRKIIAVREAISARDELLPLAQELYRTLIPPALEKDLRQARAETLMWSLDGSLRYLPLAALHDGKQYLIEKYRIAVFTPASESRLKDAPRSQWTVAGFGVTEARETFSALPFADEELAGIVRGFKGDSGVLPGEAFLNAKFTEESLRQQLRGGPAAVHIASHFRFRPGNNTESFLLLGNGRLSLADVERLPPFRNVDLLTLSACNTGLGDTAKRGDGREVEGLGVIAQRKGAAAVIASLWSVADSSTSLLMREFYRLRQSDPRMTKAEALRQAQLGLLHGNLGGTPQPAPGGGKSQGEAAKEPLFSHPFYWAPFFLMGNWL
jgi:CHAT domain-containing protein/tetratricopeptide (TPR) repeat protein